MKIVAMADPHEASVVRGLKIPDGDVLTVSGDLTYKGSLEELREVADALANLPHKHKIVIAGNHDFCLEGRKFRQPFKNSQVWQEAETILVDAGLIYLKDSGYSIDGKTFWGAPWTPEYHSWAFNVDRGDLYKKWDKIPHNLDVLLVHGPPFGYGDMTVNRERVGDDALLYAISETKPRHVCYGHIHEDVGTRRIRDTMAHNCSVGYPVYRDMPQYLPVEFEI